MTPPTIPPPRSPNDADPASPDAEGTGAARGSTARPAPPSRTTENRSSRPTGPPRLEPSAPLPSAGPKPGAGSEAPSEAPLEALPEGSPDAAPDADDSAGAPPTLRTPSRRPWKKPGRSVKAQYGLTVQVALILVLALLLGATHVRLPALTELRVDLEPQEVVAIQQMQQTRQQETAPPPPRPAPPIEVSNDVVLEEQEVNFDASLDLTEELAVTGPPPAPEPPAPAEEERVEEIFVVVEEAPTLIGGMAGLHANVRYPETARRAGVQGRVIVQFVVDEDGRVVDPVVLAGRHPLLDKEALRVIQEARFTPGRQRGTPVKVRMSIPITFVLQDR